MLPSVVGGAVIPLGVYYLVRSHVSGDATALAIAGVPAAMWVGIQWLRLRRIDPIGAIILFGFIAGLIVSAALGGNAFVLKVRDSAFTGLFGLSCLASLAFSRPLMFYVGRAMSAGDDPVRREAYDALWEMPQARRVFAMITTVWGIGLLTEAGLRVLLAAVLPTGPFLAIAPTMAAVMIGGMFAFTVWYSKWARQRGEAERALELGLAPDTGPV
jgi:hypothetical protein